MHKDVIRTYVMLKMGFLSIDFFYFFFHFTNKKVNISLSIFPSYSSEIERDKQTNKENKTQSKPKTSYEFIYCNISLPYVVRRKLNYYETRTCFGECYETQFVCKRRIFFY